MSANEVARSTRCTSNLERIGLALRSYESANGRLPPAVVADKQGNVMHSWRTLILPYLDRRDLYEKYSLRESWEGPNNGKIRTQFLPVYCCPDDRWIDDRQATSYLALTGPGTVWDDHRTAGTPPRVMVVEVLGSGIQWSEPRDLPLDQACRGISNGPGPRIAGHNGLIDGFFSYTETVTKVHVLLSDLSVRSIPVGLQPETLSHLFAGDEKAWKACEEFPPVRQGRMLKVHWANCTALAVLIISYAVLLFRPRERRSPDAEPAIPSPPAASGGNGSGD
jgi:hypothetical protein